MWFWLSLIALLCWSGSDLFSKIGCRDPRDKFSPLKMVIAVGVVMGLHAAYEIFVGGTEINLSILLPPGAGGSGAGVRRCHRPGRGGRL